MRGGTWGRILAALVVVGGLALIAVSAYQAGYAEGAVTDGGVRVVERMPLYGFGVIGVMFKVLFFFLIFGLLARLFWHRPWHRGGPGHHMGPWGSPEEWQEAMRARGEQRFAEWHERAHGAPSSAGDGPEGRPR